MSFEPFIIDRIVLHCHVMQKNVHNKHVMLKGNQKKNCTQENRPCTTALTICPTEARSESISTLSEAIGAVRDLNDEGL